MPKYKKYDQGETIVDPLCVFCLSLPRFSIQKKSSTTSSSEESCDPSLAPTRRLDSVFLFSASKRKLNRKKSSASLNKTVAGLFNYNRRQTLSLKEILSTVQSVWKSPDLTSARILNETMENNNNNSRKSINEFSPILQRRRLSAPETVMRKHLLTQERSHSQDSKNYYNNHWETNNNQSSSDPNLWSRKLDSNFMRKSTLLRRFWGNTKPKLPGSFQEWQHTHGKLPSTQSLNSVHSSPERSKVDFRGSPQRFGNGSPKRISPKKSINSNNIQNSSPKKISMGLQKTNSLESASNFNNATNIPPLRLVSQDSTNYNSRSSDTTKYTYSSFTTYSDNSDSAYTNSISNNYNSSNVISSSTSTKGATNYENCNSIAQNNLISKSVAQPQDITNLNVISNIKLSQKTLDVIISQIMQDVNSLVPGEINLNTATVTTNNNSNLEIGKNVHINGKNDNYLKQITPFEEVSTQIENNICDTQNKEAQSNLENIKTNNNAPENESDTENNEHKSFFLKTDKDSSITSVESEQIKNFIISNIESGSTYTKPTEDPPVVPRFSAIPRTISMEVNTSNGEHENEESDSASFVDSLEDFNSPRIINHDDKPVGRSMDIYQLLPDGSNQSKEQVQKSAAFFVPITVEKKKNLKAVSELLPLKMRKRLNQRQQKREEKCQQIKAAKSFRHLDDTPPDGKTHMLNFNAQRKRSKPVLPRITLLSKSSGSDKPANKENMSKRAKSVTVENDTRRKSSWENRGGTKSNEENNGIFSSINQHLNKQEKTKIYQKTEIKSSHKKIEILEIMECVEVSKSPRDKSKIPIPVHQTQNKKLSFEKPVFLDMKESSVEDTKLDQLIANILIDTLNHDLGGEKISKETIKNYQNNDNFYTSEPKSPNKQNSNQKFQQKFDVIPEEMSFLQSTFEERVNNNESESTTEFNDFLSRDANKNIKFLNVESPPLVMRKEDSSSSIPKGWITFYTIRKDAQKTPESTSDEGKIDVKPNEKPPVPQVKDILNLKQDSAKSNATYKVVKIEKQENMSISSSSEERSIIQQFSTNGRARKSNASQRKSRIKNNEDGNERKNSGEWSVTISGSNNYGQTAPDVEMRLKFPNPQNYKTTPFNQNHSDSGLGEENSQERNCTFPKIENNRTQITDRDRRAKTSFNSINDEGLPRIQIKDKRNKKRESSLISNATNAMMIPRQNKASTCRYQLSRPREIYSLPDVPSRVTDRRYSELLRRFPELLAVTGRSISPERKQDNFG